MIKIVAISDTHGHQPTLPEGDVLIVAGDWSGCGTYQETRKFLKWMKEIRHRYDEIYVVPGNHDKIVEQEPKLIEQECDDIDVTLLINKEARYRAHSFYGHPYTPEFCNWAFMGDEEKLKLINDAIPDNIDVLITHGPAHYTLDKLPLRSSAPGTHCGDKSLRDAILRVQPQYHIFGHIHSNSGITKVGNTTIVNAAYLDDDYKTIHGHKVVYL